MRVLAFVEIVGLSLMWGSAATAQIPKAYFGLLHAHTWYSDGSGTPDEAYARAKTKGLDFFAVTPHNHAEAESGAKERKDGVLIATRHELYDGASDLTFERRWKDHGESKHQRFTGQKSVIRAANERTDAHFAALYGQEFSTISSGNHVNVLDYPHVLTLSSGDFRPLYQMLAASGVAYVVQLNHPDVHTDLFYSGNDPKTKSQMYNDYGFDEYQQDFALLVAAADPFVMLCELFSGPAMKQQRIAGYHYEDHEDDYYFYLVQGFHISPSAGEDNHYATWGDVTDARMGVYAKKGTAGDLLEAMRANRTFASEDEDLSVMLRINSQEMGSVLTLPADAPLDIRVEISDADEPSADYDVTLVYGDVAAANRTNLVEWRAKDGELEEASRHGNGAVQLTGYLASGRPEFFYARITQNGGQRAFTAPVWINHPRPESGAGYVWSKKSKSKLYHDSTCKVVQMISPANLVTGTPPAGWRKHDCKLVETDGH